MASYNDGKLEVIQYVLSLEPTSILDVGACDGKWSMMLVAAGYRGRLDACEIYGPNASQILGLYDNVFVGDIAHYRYASETYDVILFGDIIEHMDPSAAYIALMYARYHTRQDVIVGVPFQYPQGEIYGNPYERHIQDDLTPEIFEERYGAIGLELWLRPRADYAYYKLKR